MLTIRHIYKSLPKSKYLNVADYCVKSPLQQIDFKLCKEDQEILRKLTAQNKEMLGILVNKNQLDEVRLQYYTLNFKWFIVASVIISGMYFQH